MKQIKLIFIAIAGILNLYVLFSIILFKLSPLQLSVMLDQLQLVVERPALLQSRLHTANFMPFYTIRESLSISMTTTQKLNLYGNILIFVPTGMLMALLVSRHKISSAALASFMLSLLLESLQLLLLMGSFDVDDLILNTLGGIAGALLASIMRLLWKSLTNKKADEDGRLINNKL